MSMRALCWLAVGLGACKTPPDVSMKLDAGPPSTAASAVAPAVPTDVALPAPVSSMLPPTVAAARPPRRPVKRLMRLYSSLRILEPAPVKGESVTADAVLDMRRQIAGERKLRVELEAFDARTLRYVRLREDGSYGLKVVHVVERRLIVRRSLEAEQKLGLESFIDFYERGDRGVLGGARPEEVVKAWGEPRHAVTLGALGNCDWIYDDREVRFLAGVVASTGDHARLPSEIPANSTPASNAGCLSISGSAADAGRPTRKE